MEAELSTNAYRKAGEFVGDMARKVVEGFFLGLGLAGALSVVHWFIT